MEFCDGPRPWRVVCSGAGCVKRWSQQDMMRPYIIYYTYKQPCDKKPGAIKQFRIYANSQDEARRLATQYANYPDIEVLRIKSI